MHVRKFKTDKKILLEEGKKYLMIMDNAPWHKKAIRLISDKNDATYNDIREKVDFINIPPYSPDLNPIEQVWRITRREKTHNRYFDSLSSLTNVLDEFFDSFKNGSEKLKSLCSFKCFGYGDVTSKCRN